MRNIKTIRFIARAPDVGEDYVSNLLITSFLFPRRYSLKRLPREMRGIIMKYALYTLSVCARLDNACVGILNNAIANPQRD